MHFCPPVYDRTNNRFLVTDESKMRYSPRLYCTVVHDMFSVAYWHKDSSSLIPKLGGSFSFQPQLDP